jgi:hypothetical protein
MLSIRCVMAKTHNMSLLILVYLYMWTFRREHIYPDFEGPFRPSRQISKSSARIYHSDCWWSFSDITPIFKTVSIVLCNIHVQDVTCWSFTHIHSSILWQFTCLVSTTCMNKFKVRDCSELTDFTKNYYNKNSSLWGWHRW